MLRQLAQYHAKDPNNLFMVRLAQGLTHLGKGTMTLSPYHSNRQLMSPVAVAGLLATCIAFLDAKTCEWHSSFMKTFMRSSDCEERIKSVVLPPSFSFFSVHLSVYFFFLSFLSLLLSVFHFLCFSLSVSLSVSVSHSVSLFYQY